MTRIFCDSSFLVAFRHKGDVYHEKAQALIKSKLVEYFPFAFVITDYIFDETVSVLKKRVSPHVAIREAERLKTEVALEYIGESIFTKAFEVFANYKDKLWSFTDCTA